MGALAAQDPPGKAPDLEAELSRLARAPEPKARLERADHLAKRSDTSIDAWLEAMRSFGTFEPHEAGIHEFREPLWNGARLEETRIQVLVPKGYAPGQPAALLHAAHGTGGSGRGHPAMWRQVADEIGMIVIAPTENGANDGYAFTHRERAIALAAIRWARLRFDVDENRVFATGVSRGGHLTWDLALRYPDRFAAVAPMIGGPRLNPSAGQNNLRYLENIVRLPIRDLQGSRDDPRLLFNLRLGFETLGKLGAEDAKLIEFAELGHSFDLGAVDWADLFNTKRRNAIPTEVVRIAATKGEGRAFWAEILQTDTRKVKDAFRLRVSAKTWDALDDDGQRKYVAREATKLSARLAVRMDTPGRFTAKSRHVRRFRLLLTPEMLDAKGKVSVRHNGRLRRKTATPQKRVLLREFAERFDRTFLPIAEFVY